VAVRGPEAEVRS